MRSPRRAAGFTYLTILFVVALMVFVFYNDILRVADLGHDAHGW